MPIKVKKQPRDGGIVSVTLASVFMLRMMLCCAQVPQYARIVRSLQVIGAYIIERRCGNIHTAADTGLYPTP